MLAQIGITPAHVFAPDIDEAPARAEPPRAYARRMALAKLAAVPGDDFVLTADTVVAAGARILPKAEDEATAQACLVRLSGRRHDVHTAVALRAPDGRLGLRVVSSVVGFARLDAPVLSAYLAGGEWRGKAGGYAIQGRAAAFVDFVSGSYSGVVGLPLHETMNLLVGFGWR